MGRFFKGSERVEELLKEEDYFASSYKRGDNSRIGCTRGNTVIIVSLPIGETTSATHKCKLPVLGSICFSWLNTFFRVF